MTSSPHLVDKTRQQAWHCLALNSVSYGEATGVSHGSGVMDPVDMNVPNLKAKETDSFVTAKVRKG